MKLIQKYAPFLLGISFLFAFAPLIRAEMPVLNFYYGDGCPHCAQVKPFIHQMALLYPDVEIGQYEVYKNRVNASQLTQAFEDYGIPFDKRGVPVVFLNGTYFLGDSPILDNLEGEIQKMIAASLPIAEPAVIPQLEASAESVPEIPEKVIVPFESENQATDPINTPETEETESMVLEEPVSQPEPPSLWVITGLALVDSINPCAIAVLVILLAALLVINEKKRALMGGLAFTTAIYISYFLFGLGISYSLQFFQSFAYWIFKGVGGLAVILGLANIKDFFWYGKGFVMEIPLSWRPRLKSMLRGVTSPIGAFLIGFAVTLFELPCTGGPYFVVLGLLSVHKSLSSIIPILLYYNFFFVLPLLVITALIYFGLSTVEEAGQWKDKNIRGLHLVAGLILAGLGLWILLN